MKRKQLLEILSTVNVDSDLNNVIEKIKEELKTKDPNAYEKWEKLDFNINYVKDDTGWALLCFAAEKSYTKMAKALIENGADVNALGVNKRAPLHSAAKNGDIEIVNALIEKGANIDAELGASKRTPLYLAVGNNHIEIVKVLIKNRANVDALDVVNKKTLLHYAAENGYTEIAKVLIKSGASINVLDVNKRTPLHLAAQNGHTEIVNALIENEANVNALDTNKKTPLHYAAENGHKEAANALLKKNADPLLGNKNGRTLKCLSRLIKTDSLKQLGKTEEMQQKKEQVEYELLKYSLLSRDSCPLVDVVEEDKFESLICTWFADVSSLTPGQKELNRELLSIIQACSSPSNKGGYGKDGYITRLEKFLQKNENNKDLKFILNLRRGESKSTVLHAVSSIARIGREEFLDLLLKAGADPNAQNDRGKTPLHYAVGFGNVMSLLKAGAKPNTRDDEGKTPLHCIVSANYGYGCADLLLRKGADPYIRDKQGKTPLDVAIANHQECFLTDKQKMLRQNLYSTLRTGNFAQLEGLLNEHKNTQDLEKVLNLCNDEGKPQILEFIRSTFHSDKASYREAEKLLSKVGVADDKGNRKEYLPKSGILWNNLMPNQQQKLKTFLYEVNTAQDMNELKQVVSKAIDSGVRLNFPHQGSLYEKTYESKYSCMDYVIKQINGLLEKSPKVKSDIEVASSIVCKLVSKGGVLYNVNSLNVLDTLESEFEGHKSNMVRAHKNYVKHALKFMEVVKSAATGKVEDARVDNSDFYLKYSEDSKIDVAKITDGARSLGLTQGKIEYGRNIIKIGKSEVEIITEKETRNYTDLANGSDIALTFYTSQGELEVRLCPDKQDKDLIRVEVKDQKTLKKLEDCKEEIGRNCRLGGLKVNKAIEQGSFTRSGKLCQPPESLSVSSSLDNVSLPSPVQEIRQGQ